MEKEKLERRISKIESLLSGLKYCTSCGILSLPEKAEYCPHCGQKLEEIKRKEEGLAIE